MPYNSGAVATERSSVVSYNRMPVPTSSRYSASSSSSYRSSLSDRPYYSSSYSSTSARATIPRSPITSEYRHSYSTTTTSRSAPVSHTRSSLGSDDSSKRSSLGSSSRDRSESRDTSASSGVTRTTVAAARSRFSDQPVATGGLSRRISSLDSDFYSKYSPTNYVPNSTSTSSEASSARPPLRPTASEDKTSTSTSTLRSRASVAAAKASESASVIGGCERRPPRDLTPLDQDDASSSYDRTKKASENNGLSGLVNIGNTCFMNSVIQCLSNTKPLLDYLLSESYTADLNTNSSMKGKLITAFSEVVRELWSCAGCVVSPVAFKSQISRYAPRFTGYSQQDAQEFLRFLLEGVHEDVNRVRVRPKNLGEVPDTPGMSPEQKAAEQWKRYLRQDDSKIVDLFVGQLRSTLKCSVCGHSSMTFDPFWDLQLPIPAARGAGGSVRLQQCLDHFTTEEVLDGNEKAYCAQCEKNQKSTKSFTIQKFPKILVLQLNRFSPSDRYRRKLSVTVDFPLDRLDLSAYAASSSPASQCVYSLYAVANHSGSPTFGHYTAQCRHPVSKRWYQYNDSRVSSISPRSVVSSEAYLLFYELASRSSHL